MYVVCMYVCVYVYYMTPWKPGETIIALLQLLPGYHLDMNPLILNSIGQLSRPYHVTSLINHWEFHNAKWATVL